MDSCFLYSCISVVLLLWVYWPPCWRRFFSSTFSRLIWQNWLISDESFSLEIPALPQLVGIGCFCQTIFINLHKKFNTSGASCRPCMRLHWTPLDRFCTKAKVSLKKLTLARSFLLRFFLRLSALLKDGNWFLIYAWSTSIPSFPPSAAFLHCFFSCRLSLISLSISGFDWGNLFLLFVAPVFCSIGVNELTHPFQFLQRWSLEVIKQFAESLLTVFLFRFSAQFRPFYEGFHHLAVEGWARCPLLCQTPTLHKGLSLVCLFA